MKCLKFIILGALTGFVNAFFGSGGGIIAVSLYKSEGLSQKQAQASSMCVILALSAVSCVAYYLGKSLDVGFALPLLPLPIIAAALGSRIMKRISSKALRIIFACFMLWAGVRMLVR